MYTQELSAKDTWLELSPVIKYTQFWRPTLTIAAPQNLDIVLQTLHRNL